MFSRVSKPIEILYKTLILLIEFFMTFSDTFYSFHTRLKNIQKLHHNQVTLQFPWAISLHTNYIS